LYPVENAPHPPSPSHRAVGSSGGSFYLLAVALVTVLKQWGLGLIFTPYSENMATIAKKIE
jgi:hypothetical protein